MAEWRRRACVLHAVRLLSTGRPVAEVAADVGYASPGAFSTMFQQLVGAPPREFLNAGRPA
ncbi:AraC-like DNA-binding protein [Kibdelosporangium phytohabitans]|nr:AraC-like DNA-binding protein [Kibdelosporangium phytohabitans]